jgi:hypothetical protein
MNINIDMNILEYKLFLILWTKILFVSAIGYYLRMLEITKEKL